MRVVNISLPDETDDRGDHCVGAWPKGITVGNWREGGWAAHSFIQFQCPIKLTRVGF